MPRRPLRLGPAASAVVEQALNGATNFALIVLLSQQVSADAVGRFSILLLIVQVGVLVERGCAGGVLLASRSAADRRPVDVEGASAIGLVVGFLSAVGVVAAGMLLGLGAATSVVWGIAGCIVVLQDVWRHASFRSHRFGLAAGGAALWIVVMFAASVVAIAAGADPTIAYPGAWAAGAVVSLAVLRSGEATVGFLPRPSRARRFLAEQRSLVHTMMVEQVIGNGTSLVGLGAVALLLPLDEVGHVRIAQVAIGPLAVCVQAAASFATSSAARLDPATQRSALERLMWGTSLATFAAGIGWLIIVLVLPAGLGVRLLGDSWLGGEPLARWMAVQTALHGLSVGSVAIASGLNAGAPLRRRRIITTLVFVTGQAVGAAVWGAPGFVVAGTILTAAGLVVWTTFGVGLLRHPKRRASDTPGRERLGATR